MDDTNIEKRGLDPNSNTGTRDAVDPETGTVGTAGTPLTAGYGMSGSTIGIGSEKGEEQHERDDFGGATPDTKDYTAGGQGQTREPIPAPKPSQAEGDRETIEQDLREKEAGGQI
jgi:hypothetical protein